MALLTKTLGEFVADGVSVLGVDCTKHIVRGFYNFPFNLLQLIRLVPISGKRLGCLHNDPIITADKES